MRTREGGLGCDMDNVTAISAAKVAGKVWRDVRPLFYLELPSTSSYQHVSEVPDYLKQVVPYFFVLIVVEMAVRRIQGLPKVRFNDSINSLTAGLLLLLAKMMMGGIDISLYVWFHSRFCVYELPWDSPWTWLFAFLGVDCAYYWFHRMAHEVNLFWAAHQTHHSSEDYTLSTALRQSTVQGFTSMFVYLPLALLLPTPLYFAHKQLNLLYQFWIHTEVVDRLGVLEWVLNTPSHHRVHHGRNPYCIDCNYAGVLIIWDRMFGTFQPELREEKVVYGLVHPLATWEPLWAQLHHYAYIVQRLVRGEEGEGWAFRLQFLFKGPGWTPGKPRLGCREDIPQVSPNEKPYNRRVSKWLNMYIGVHFIVVLIIARTLGEIHMNLPLTMKVAVIGYCVLSLSCLGLFLEDRPSSVPLEMTRLSILLVALTQPAILAQAAPVSYVFSHPVVLQVVVSLSLVLWVVKAMWRYTGTDKTVKKE